MKTRLCIAALILLLIPVLRIGMVTPSASAAEIFSGKCVGVIDGDSIQVMRGKKEEEVRLEGIDCPEWYQDFSRRAKQFTSSLVFGKTVTVYERGNDDYGRVVGRVHLGEIDVSKELVRAGLAWHYTRYSDDLVLAAEEEAARAARRGLWGLDEPVPPWEYRARQRKASLRPEPDDSPFHGNVKSMKFHAASCPHYDCKNCIKVFQTREQALEAGYEPCGRCKP